MMMATELEGRAPKLYLGMGVKMLDSGWTVKLDSGWTVKLDSGWTVKLATGTVVEATFGAGIALTTPMRTENAPRMVAACILVTLAMVVVSVVGDTWELF
jgi:hypothetical protein